MVCATPPPPQGLSIESSILELDLHELLAGNAALAGYMRKLKLVAVTPEWKRLSQEHWCMLEGSLKMCVKTTALHCVGIDFTMFGTALRLNRARRGTETKDLWFEGCTYSATDLELLFQGIKVLDSFMAVGDTFRDKVDRRPLALKPFEAENVHIANIKGSFYELAGSRLITQWQKLLETYVLKAAKRISVDWIPEHHQVEAKRVRYVTLSKIDHQGEPSDAVQGNLLK